MYLEYAIVFVGAYLIGSIPFGLILTRMAGLGDIRQIGSGNIGATNVMRTGNKKLGIATLLLDAGKGVVALLFGTYMAYILKADVFIALQLSALAALLGHVFSVWLKFKGGKGVATYLGIIFACLFMRSNTEWYSGELIERFLMVGGVWLIVFLMFRMSSLASLCQVWGNVLIVSYGIGFMDFHSGLMFTLKFFWIFPAAALLITYTHRENIKRIIAGNEHKFGKKKSPTP